MLTKYLINRTLFSVKFSDIERFCVPVKISDIKVVNFFRNLDYRYYIGSYEFARGNNDSYSNYLCVTNSITFRTEKTQNKEFTPWNYDDNVWKVLPEYGIDAYWSQHYARGRRLYVNSDDLALALIIDASIEKAAVEKRNKIISSQKAKIEKAVDNLFAKFPNDFEYIKEYINNTY